MVVVLATDTVAAASGVSWCIAMRKADVLCNATSHAHTKTDRQADTDRQTVRQAEAQAQNISFGAGRQARDARA